MLDNYRDLIDELLETPTLVRERVARSNDQPGLASLLIALRQRDQEMLARLRLIVKETEPHLRAVPGIEAALTDVHATHETPADLIASLDTARGDLVSLLMNLTLKDWEKKATHDDGGYVTLADEVEDHVEFDEALRHRLGLAEHR